MRILAIHENFKEHYVRCKLKYFDNSSISLFRKKKLRVAGDLVSSLKKGVRVSKYHVVQWRGTKFLLGTTPPTTIR